MSKIEMLKIHKEEIQNLCDGLCELTPVSDYVAVINDLLNSFLENEGPEITHAEAKEVTFNVTTLTTFLIKLSEEASAVRSLEISLTNEAETN